ncbi:hypothetical protein SAMN02745121_07102 [Nannocystis exedens]|uniref:Tetratricopeptide repeat-containing protein n=1 Tax=Nannocystis exedens TaxID=54 RepID=A0A1I2G7W4_9BACT|nr:hypothetical protein [Nannocystis exedens]PCC67345.1 hypothetical protein NAEX_00349 [Nannocystis exedens]SFF13695.1 hypothetical protein SAMN02745121_07102 [Nannocystis exedens]
MATHEDDRLPPELAPFTRDTADHLDRLVARARPTPDFAAMLARARELDPAAVSADAVARAEALPPVVPLAPGEGKGDAEALAPFTGALKAELDGKLAERRLASIPPPQVSRRRRIGVALGVAAALAAAVLLAVVGPDLVARRADQRGTAAALEGAGGRHGETRVGGTTEVHVDGVAEPRAAVPEDMPWKTSSEDVLEDMPEKSSSPVPASPAADDPTDEKPRKPVAKDGPRRRKPVEDLAPAPAGPSLEDEAQLLWQKGELAAAERKYREILALPGAGARAELAYGDLFALARQLRGGDGQAAVWREYLRRFPSGRFADDARAGLCRRSPAVSRAACWQDYLEHHPAGAHRKQAEAALAGAAGGEAP